MGELRSYLCPQCNYSAVVAGGRETGMVVVVDTMTCRSCADLVDVVMGFFGGEWPTGIAEYDKDLGTCPECGGRDVEPWGKAHPCRRCGASMAQDGRINVCFD